MIPPGPVRHRAGVLGGAVVLAAPLATLATLAACSGSNEPASVPSVASAPSATAAHADQSAPARWWSTVVSPLGSPIDVRHPTVAADLLRPSRAGYCLMLRQTVHAGRTILPGVGARDPALAAATEAFVAELQHVAPAAVASSWRVLGAAVVAVVLRQAPATGDAGAVRRAGLRIASDASRLCEVDVSA